MALVLVALALSPAHAIAPTDTGATAATADVSASRRLDLRGPSGRPTAYARIQNALSEHRISKAQATVLLARAIYAPRTLPRGFRGSLGRDATLARIRLEEALGSLDAAHARVVDRLIGSRANDPHWCDDSTGPLPNVKQTRHFVIYYDAIAGGLTIGDYAAVLEHVWDVEVKSFGWARPPSFTSNPAPNGKYPVRIAFAGINTYGYVSGGRGAHAGLVGDNPYTGWNEGDARASCMVLNPGFDNLGSANNLNDLKVTVAHEFLHSIQNGLGVITADDNYIEGAAAWIEDEVYDAINDNYQYLWPRWGESMGAYPTDNDAWYGYWLVWRGLTEQYGTGIPGGAEDVMQRIFVNLSKGKALLPATEKAFEAERTYLSYVYHQFAIAARFTQRCGGGYVAPFCFEEALSYILAESANFPVDGTVTKTQSYTGAIRDDYASNWVKLPDRPKHYPIFVKNTSASSPLFWSVACDLGTSLRVDIWAPLEPGKTAELGVDRSGCTGPSYVTITNAHNSAPDPTASPKASYKVWVPYIPMTGSVTWSVTGSTSGAEGVISWNESWTENGSLTLAIKRDPANYANYLVVDNGSSYTVGYTYSRTEYNSFTECSTTFSGTGNGSGAPTTAAGYMGSTYPNLDPPDPADDYNNPDVLGLAFGATMDYTENWSGSCGSGTNNDPNAPAPFYRGLYGATLPVCVPPALAGADPSYWAGWSYVGAWNDGAKRFEFGCAETLPIPGGSQTITIGGTASHAWLP